MTDRNSGVRLLLDASVKRAIPVPILMTRLELRPFQDSDIDGIVQLLTDREATRFIGDVRTPEAAAESVRLMRDAHASRGWGTLAVILRENGDCLGYCGVRPLPHTIEVEVAFALQRRYWNLGYATEAASASIDAAFNGLEVESIVATVYPENRASIRVLTKLGMQFDSEVFGHWPMNTALLYRINREAWRSRSKPTK